MHPKWLSFEDLVGLASGDDPLFTRSMEGARARGELHPAIPNPSSYLWYKRTAEECFGGWIFVSHCVADFAKIDRVVFNPVSNVDHHVFLWNSTFLHEGAVQTHLPLVAQVLRVAKTVIVCVSRSAMQSNWVKAEAFWAVSRRNPIIVCKLDDTHPCDFFSKLNTVEPAVYAEIDFSRDEQQGTIELLSLIRTDPFKPCSWKDWRLGEINTTALSHLIDYNNPGRYFIAHIQGGRC